MNTPARRSPTADSKAANLRKYAEGAIVAWSRFESEPSKEDMAQRLEEFVAPCIRAGDTLLDVGGGSGYYAARIESMAGARAVVVDLCAANLREARRSGSESHLVAADMERLPLASRSVDAVMFVASLHHVPDPIGALKEASRVLRHGGLLFVAEPCSLRLAFTSGSRPTPDPEDYRFGAAFLCRCLRLAGFDVLRKESARVLKRAWPAALGSPPLWVLKMSRRLDRVLARLPGSWRIGPTLLVKAVLNR